MSDWIYLGTAVAVIVGGLLYLKCKRCKPIPVKKVTKKKTKGRSRPKKKK